jgi:hypothetical protein
MNRAIRGIVRSTKNNFTSKSALRLSTVANNTIKLTFVDQDVSNH